MRWLFGLALLGAAACATAPRPSALYVSPDAYDFSANPKLLARIRHSPHGYFRFINQQFSEAVCRRLSAMPFDGPRVNLHGDAHLEQYAVTDLGRGLTDFDDATSGPAPIDLLRFGVSLSLATETRGWRRHTDALLDRFLAGYRRALRTPSAQAPMPAVAERMRRSFSTNRPAYFEWVESVSEPMDDPAQRAVKDALEPYVATMKAEAPDLDPRFFEVIEVRRLRLGIGSALDDKFLIRVRGATAAPVDDVILEAKEVRDLSGVSCVTASKAQDPFRVLVAQSRIAYRPYRFLGYMRLAARTFWIHAWVDNYRELELGKSARTPEELAEVAYDVGVQLGRGHPNQIGAPLDRQFRMALLTMLERHEADYRESVRILAQGVLAAWRRFRSERPDAGEVGSGSTGESSPAR